MSRLLLGTRKGLFTLGHSSGEWAVEDVAFVGDPVIFAMSDPRDGTVYAALDLGHFGPKLRRSEPSGEWTDLPAPAFPPQPENEADIDPIRQTPREWSVKKIWTLAAGATDQPGRIWAGTIPGGLFKSDDRGESWELVESLWNHPDRARWFGGGMDDPGIHAICIDPRDSRRILVGVSCGGCWVTEDDGQTWRSAAAGMFAEFMPPEQRYDEAIQDPHCVVQSPSHPDIYWCQHHNGVFRSSDGAQSWQEVKDISPSSFGFAVAVHPHDGDTAWFVPAQNDDVRVPVDGRLVVNRTRDGGKSFEALTSGLPGSHAYHIVYRHSLDVDGTGKLLAFGSTTGGLFISEDGGEQWTILSRDLPPIYSLRFG
jgi:hypothetical protein